MDRQDSSNHHPSQLQLLQSNQQYYYKTHRMPIFQHEIVANSHLTFYFTTNIYKYKLVTNMRMQKWADQQPHSLPFITYSKEKGYAIAQQAVQFLATLPENDNYSVLAIVGKAKTGKSFLMNHLIQDPNMFAVSNTIENEKSSIQLSTKLIESDDKKIIVLDVGGFGSIEGNDDQDCKMFILAILLSSVIIYNSSGTIDQQSLNNLSMVIEIGKVLQKELLNPSSLPSLFWVLRDFSLKMQDKNGSEITANQYLEKALEEQKGESKTILQKNRIRRIIKALFTDRKCETLVLPTQQINFDSSSEPALRKEFLEDFVRFKNKLLGLVRKKGEKSFCEIKMTRDSFIDAARIYVQTLNKSTLEGTIPKIQNMTYKLRQSQAQAHINKFTQNINVKREQLLEKMVQLKREESKGFSKSQLLASYQEIFQPIQEMYNQTLKSINSLIGPDFANIIELEKMKKMFYEVIENQGQEIQRREEQHASGIKRSSDEPEIDEEEQLRLANICEFFLHIFDENELEKQYFNEIKSLRSRHLQKNTMYFSNLLMKLEIAFLRRKIQLTSSNNLLVKRLEMELQYNRKQIEQLTAKTRELQNQLMHDKQSKKNSFITPNKAIPNKRQKTAEGNKKEFSTYGKENAFGSKIESLSFYIPYVTIDKAEYLESKIIRTLIKEDSRRNSYIEYVIEVNLLDQKWVLNRKFKDFSQLHSILVMMYQSVSLPQCQAITGCVKMLESNPQMRKEIVETRRKQLQEQMSELISIESIRNSRILQKFLKINKQYIVL